MLHTPKVHCASSVDDVLEPMRYVYEAYLKPNKLKCYGVGTSMGGMIMTNVLATLGDESFISGAAIVHAPIEMSKCEKHIIEACGGLYNREMAQNVANILLRNEKITAKWVKEKCHVNLRDKILELHRDNLMCL